jgi:hypothetical protein
MKINVSIRLALQLKSGHVCHIDIDGAFSSPSMPVRGSRIFYPRGEDSPVDPEEQDDYFIVTESDYVTGLKSGTLIPTLKLCSLVDDNLGSELRRITDLAYLQSTFLGLQLLLHGGAVIYWIELDNAENQLLHAKVWEFPVEIRRGLTDEYGLLVEIDY